MPPDFPQYFVTVDSGQVQVEKEYVRTGGFSRLAHSRDEVQGFCAIGGDLELVWDVMCKEGLANQEYIAPIVLREQDVDLSHCASVPGSTI